MRETLARCFEDAEAVLHALRNDAETLELLTRAGGWIAECFRSEGRVLICGNGGSMADALHFAEEWTGRFRNDRRSYAAMALGEAAHMSCVANDFGFEQVFARQVEAFGREDDLLILLSTSGNSANLLRAAESARKRGVRTLALVGRGGGPLAGKCDLSIDFPGKTSDRIQEAQMTALHALIEAVEKELGH